MLSAPSNHSLGMGVLGATKGVVGLTRNLPHGPSIPSPGSIPLHDTDATEMNAPCRDALPEAGGAASTASISSVGARTSPGAGCYPNSLE